MRNIKMKFTSFLTAIFILLGTSLPVAAVDTHINTTNYKYSYVTKAKKDYTVYITKTGKKYHADGCRYLKKSCRAIKKSKAVGRGYTPCSRCSP